MGAGDVKDTLDQAIALTGVTNIPVRHRPRLLSDNGPCYLSSELKAYLKDRQMGHTRGAPYHPMTQGKIERYHQIMDQRAMIKQQTLQQRRCENLTSYA